MTPPTAPYATSSRGASTSPSSIPRSSLWRSRITPSGSCTRWRSIPMRFTRSCRPNTARPWPSAWMTPRWLTRSTPKSPTSASRRTQTRALASIAQRAGRPQRSIRHVLQSQPRPSPSSSPGSDQSELPALVDGLGPVDNAKLAHNVAQVRFDRLLANEELLTDIAVGQSRRYQAQYLDFPRTQRVRHIQVTERSHDRRIGHLRQDGLGIVAMGDASRCMA